MYICEFYFVSGNLAIYLHPNVASLYIEHRWLLVNLHRPLADAELVYFDFFGAAVSSIISDFGVCILEDFFTF